MYRLNLILLLIIFGCTGSIRNTFKSPVKQSFEELKTQFKLSSGKGTIELSGPMKGKFSFSYKSKDDSTFLEFNDLIGRKALLIWLTPNFITARNLIENRQYENSEIISIFPLLSIIKPIDITKILWGVEPDYKDRLKELSPAVKKNIVIKFSYKNPDSGNKAITEATYFNKITKQLFVIDIKNRNYNNQSQNMKKVWKLLEY